MKPLLKEVLSKLENIGMIGSPSSTTEMSLDILGSAIDKKLIGELATFQFLQDGKNHCAIGQITEIQLRNVWLEGASLRSIARHKGQVNPVSGQQDTHLGKMTISAVFSQEDEENFDQSLLGTVPATGTYISIATNELLNKILNNQKNDIFYLGKVYSSTPYLPMQFRHFGSSVTTVNGQKIETPNGAGEAYHIGVFGKTGSGKSFLSKMILCSYLKYSQMGILILDPQGEFSKDFTGRNNEETTIPLKEVAEKYSKQVAIFSVNMLVLDRWELFDEILFESVFFENLTLRKNENRNIACKALIERLRKKSITMDALHKRETFDLAWQILKDDKVQKMIYKTEEIRILFDDALNNANIDDFYTDYWKPVAELFNKSRANARTVDKAISWLLSTNSVLVVDLSRKNADGLYWNEKIQSLVTKRLLQGIIQNAENVYNENRLLNTLVLIDEAHRLAPRETNSDEVLKSVKDTLVRAVRETRKFGLGWMFISQTLASLDKEIINQLRISFFGFGLSMGTEFQTLKEIAGGNSNALTLYQSFKDPHSSLNPNKREYSFMTVGPASPLSFSGSPLFFTSLNNIDTFLDVNNLRK